MSRIYFDNAATTPLDPEVMEIMVRAYQELHGNPSSIHEEGRRARAAIEQARKEIAVSLNSSIGEIFFTSGGTEANNMALKCAVRDLGVQRIISARTEHHCVLHSLDALRRDQGTETVFVRQTQDGRLELEHLESLLASGGPKTLVSLMHANNEVGTLANLQEIGTLCRRFGAYFHTDTVQTLGYYPINLKELPIDFLAGSAHKFHGPKGVGFIYINQQNALRPFLDGGSQERNMRGGTENIAGILGMAAALLKAYGEIDSRRAKIREVRDYLAQRLEEAIPDIEWNGDPFGQGHYKLLSVGFPPGPKTELLLLNLDIAGIAVSGGSACSSGADAGSHVMDALKKDSPRKTIRFSFSHHNTLQEVDYLMEQLKKIGI
ncbi:MAG: cysteine desulfurase [Haliscomenobacter sp.]|nr:cysteine desulfurase [Haliscomenobacter sp.]MBP9075886.1 cysteine desulfurase [Haliscomenobacter sp.]